MVTFFEGYQGEGQIKEDLPGTKFRRAVIVLWIIFGWTMAIVLSVLIATADEGKEEWYSDVDDGVVVVRIVVVIFILLDIVVIDIHRLRRWMGEPMDTTAPATNRVLCVSDE